MQMLICCPKTQIFYHKKKPIKICCWVVDLEIHLYSHLLRKVLVSRH